MSVHLGPLRVMDGCRCDYCCQRGDWDVIAQCRRFRSEWPIVTDHRIPVDEIRIGNVTIKNLKVPE